MRWLTLLCLIASSTPLAAQTPAKKPDGNRLAYLDELDPYYPHRDFPKLITPQWVGEKDVECVVILAIDDMRDPKRYETFLRPILRRLKQIDGRAPLSIMTNQVDPKDPQLQAWLKEGLSLECHTLDHPCPFFKGGFDKAKETYDKCVDLMNEIPNNKPVAFRMPCCDSLNTPSPRFWAEMFNQMTEKGNFLSIDSSVFNVFTSADPELPRELVLNDKGQERFSRYLPTDRTFVNTIENYPYPYVIGRLCWEFPCVTPSDWLAQHLQKPNNPNTIRDFKAALDCAVVKKGVFCLVFHPHGWISNDQVVELIDHAVQKHGKKVKFLNFKEALLRLNKNLLFNHALRYPPRGWDCGVRLLDLDQDGYLDTVVGHIGGKMVQKKESHLWDHNKRVWKQLSLPIALAGTHDLGKRWPSWPQLLNWRFATVKDGAPLIIGNMGGISFLNSKWVDSDEMTNGLEIKNQPLSFVIPKKETPDQAVENGIQLADLDGDGRCELIVANPNDQAVFGWSDKEKKWKLLPFSPPKGALFVDGDGKAMGLRFLDLNNDGKLDIVFSNEKEYGVYLFTDMEKGWSKKIMAGKRGDPGALPMISRHGTNNGCWVHSGHLWWSNEDTVLLKDHVDRRSFKELLGQ